MGVWEFGIRKVWSLRVYPCIYLRRSHFHKIKRLRSEVLQLFMSVFEATIDQTLIVSIHVHSLWLQLICRFMR